MPEHDLHARGHRLVPGDGFGYMLCKGGALAPASDEPAHTDAEGNRNSGKQSGG